MQAEIQPITLKRRLRPIFGNLLHQALKITEEVPFLVRAFMSPNAEMVSKSGEVAAKGKAVVYGKGPDSTVIFTCEGTIVFPNEKAGDTIRLTRRLTRKK